MDAVKLMNRIDTKYILPAATLPGLLSEINGSYRSLIVENKSISRYRTLYFDSPDYRFYLDHHNGKRPRFKVRFREYIESGTIFFEIKMKTNKSRTIKKRINADMIPSVIEEPYHSFLTRSIPNLPEVLQPAIWSSFARITLVNNNLNERITIDTDLGFSDELNKAGFPQLVVAELKRDSGSGYSELAQLLRSRKIPATRLSKYCYGIITLKEQVKRNRFKEKINFINKLKHADKSYSIAG